MVDPGRWLDTARGLICSRYTLSVAVLGFAFFYLLSAGPNRPFLYLLQALVVLHLLLPEYRRSATAAAYIALIAIALFPVAATLPMPEDMTYPRYLGNIYNFLWMVLGIRFLSLHLRSRDQRPLAVVSLLLLFGLVVGHVAGSMPALEPWLLDQRCRLVTPGMECGLFPNPHLLSMFAVLTLPLAVYLAWLFPGSKRVLAMATAAGILYLLVITGSRPAWLAALSGVTLTVLLLLPTPTKWWILLGIATLCVIAYVSGVGAIDARIQDFLANIESEERLQIWPDTWHMIQDNSPRDWLLGHGVGSFRHYFSDYSGNPVFGQFVFPHNFVLGVLFESGLVGLITIAGGILVFLYALTRGYRSLATKPARYLCAALFAACVGLLIHTFFTVPFYSKPTLLPLALVMGTGMALLVPVARRAPDR